MPDVTKRILTDETGQAIVSALGALTNVVDPNGTTIAAAAKLNNMTTSATALSAGVSPTAALTTVDNHFHLTLGIPTELPTVTSTNNGQILKVESGAWAVGSAPTEIPAVTSYDNNKILQVSNGAWAAVDALPGIMTGATSETNGAAGLVPAPTTADVDKFLSGDGTYKSGGLPMVILSYGSSTWNDFMDAYRNNVIVYCRASSNANPATGAQLRMAFMAYIGGSADSPTSVEFQYYRSVSTHSTSQLGDQVFIYKLEKTGGWSVTSREASIKTLSGSGIGVSWNNNVVTLTNQADLRPWEKINEETFTNATEGDYEITVDLNNTAFSLTDVVLMFETPVQETDAEKGGYGQVKFYYDNNNCFTSESGAWTQTANTTAHGFIVKITQEPGGMFWCQETQTTLASNSGAWRTRYSTSFDTDTQGLRFLANNYIRQISRIVITKVTGTGHYKLYGKRTTT